MLENTYGLDRMEGGNGGGGGREIRVEPDQRGLTVREVIEIKTRSRMSEKAENTNINEIQNQLLTFL